MQSCLQFLDLIVQDFSLSQLLLQIIQTYFGLVCSFDIFVFLSAWRGATPPRVEMRVKLLPWMSAASSGVPRLDGLAKVARLVGESLALVEIGFEVVPAGAPISSWNCSSGK